jgi:hypothetical protein
VPATTQTKITLTGTLVLAAISPSCTLQSCPFWELATWAARLAAGQRPREPGPTLPDAHSPEVVDTPILETASRPKTAELSTPSRGSMSGHSVSSVLPSARRAPICIRQAAGRKGVGNVPGMWATPSSTRQPPASGPPVNQTKGRLQSGQYRSLRIRPFGPWKTEGAEIGVLQDGQHSLVIERP